MGKRSRELLNAIDVVKKEFKGKRLEDLLTAKKIISSVDGFNLEVEAIDEVIKERNYFKAYRSGYNDYCFAVSGVFNKPASTGFKVAKVSLNDDEENRW